MTVSCDYETPTLWAHKKVMGAKDHTCCECAGTIRKGETHDFYKFLFDGDWYAFRACPDCRVIICELTRLLGDGHCGWPAEGMMEQLEDLNYSDEERRIVAMFNVTSAARGGFRCTKFDTDDRLKQAEGAR